MFSALLLEEHAQCGWLDLKDHMERLYSPATGLGASVDGLFSTVCKVGF